MNFTVVPIPQQLQAHIECIRIAQYHGEQPLAINVCLSGLPGIGFQHNGERSPVENITTPSGVMTNIPTAYIYGQMTEPGIMNHRQQPFTMTQVILKPHALQTLLGLNASVLTNSMVNLNELSDTDLNLRLLEASDQQAQITLITDFLSTRLKRVKSRDALVEESLRLIHRDSSSITVKRLLDHLSLSERQFERRFIQTVGLSPQFYIRIKRFDAAVRLIRSRQVEKLVDVAYALNFYDQSHFIRDIKAFSGITPRSLFQKADHFQTHHGVIAYT